MLFSSPKSRLITFFKTRLMKFYLNSKLMTDPIYPFSVNNDQTVAKELWNFT